jgi:hypothetical protein
MSSYKIVSTDTPASGTPIDRVVTDGIDSDSVHVKPDTFIVRVLTKNRVYWSMVRLWKKEKAREFKPSRNIVAGLGGALTSFLILAYAPPNIALGIIGILSLATLYYGLRPLR